MYLYSLANTPLAWLAPDATTSPTPEIVLMGQPTSGPSVPWPWYVNLLQQTEQYEPAFTLDRASYIPIATNSDGTISYDYDGDSGDTIRFGDEDFGTVPDPGTVFRWTGSWLTVFTTADPEGSEQITPAEQLQLIQLLNRRRVAGYESYCPAPVYVSIDLKVYVCALPTVFNADVQTAVQTALSAAKNPDGTPGFFYVDNFTFGQPLELSALEAVIQNAYGVAGVHCILYRQRGIIVDYIPLQDEFTVQPNQILRVDNDPSRPERGSLLVYVDGGK
jgi:hypothetical protein